MIKLWTKDEMAEVERLAADGLTMRQTADKVGATYQQVNYLRRKLDIKFTPGTRTVDKEEELRKRWKNLLPELKANLLRDIAR